MEDAAFENLRGELQFWSDSFHAHLDAGAGFFIGDAAGVGKGRQVAGIVLDNYARSSSLFLMVESVHHNRLSVIQFSKCKGQGSGIS